MQAIVDPGQTQLPETQLAVGGQRVSQLPQWVTSLAVFTQAPPHTVRPAGQQTPLVHVSPLPQPRSQTPQWAGSFCVSTQTRVLGPVVQDVKGALQRHEPVWQVSLATHALSHVPQLSLSVLVFTHAVGGADPGGQPVNGGWHEH